MLRTFRQIFSALHTPDSGGGGGGGGEKRKTSVSPNDSTVSPDTPTYQADNTDNDTRAPSYNPQTVEPRTEVMTHQVNPTWKSQQVADFYRIHGGASDTAYQMLGQGRYGAVYVTKLPNPRGVHLVLKFSNGYYFEQTNREAIFLQSLNLHHTLGKHTPRLYSHFYITYYKQIFDSFPGGVLQAAAKAVKCAKDGQHLTVLVEEYVGSSVLVDGKLKPRTFRDVCNEARDNTATALSKNEPRTASTYVEDKLYILRNLITLIKLMHTEARVHHGDLHSYNIMMREDNKTPVFIDFGLACDLNTAGNTRYAQPSLWCDFTISLSISDVRSLVENFYFDFRVKTGGQTGKGYSVLPNALRAYFLQILNDKKTLPDPNSVLLKTAEEMRRQNFWVFSAYTSANNTLDWFTTKKSKKF